MIRRAFLLSALLAATPVMTAQAAPGLEVIYVGGWDCPPCAVWKKTRKPAWLASPEFRKVAWFEIESPRLREAYQERYWPLELKPLLAKLPRKAGTPRFLIVRGNEILSNEFGVPRWDATMAELKKLLGE